MAMCASVNSLLGAAMRHVALRVGCWLVMHLPTLRQGLHQSLKTWATSSMLLVHHVTKCMQGRQDTQAVWQAMCTGERALPIDGKLVKLSAAHVTICNVRHLLPVRRGSMPIAAV